MLLIHAPVWAIFTHNGDEGFKKIINTPNGEIFCKIMMAILKNAENLKNSHIIL